MKSNFIGVLVVCNLLLKTMKYCKTFYSFAASRVKLILSFAQEAESHQRRTRTRKQRRAEWAFEEYKFLCRNESTLTTRNDHYFSINDYWVAVQPLQDPRCDQSSRFGNFSSVPTNHKNTQNINAKWSNTLLFNFIKGFWFFVSRKHRENRACKLWVFGANIFVGQKVNSIRIFENHIFNVFRCISLYLACLHCLLCM